MSTASTTKKPRAAVNTATISKSSPGRMLHDAHMRMIAGLVNALRGEGQQLTAEGWAVLSLLSENDELSQLEISERVGKDRHHTSRLIDGLEKQGLVTRKPTADDRRVKLVSVTTRGRDARRRLMRVVTGFIESAFEGVSAQEFDVFIRVLAHITGRLPARNQRGDSAHGSAQAAPRRQRARRGADAQP